MNADDVTPENAPGLHARQLADPRWPAELRPLPPGTVVTTRAAIERKMLDGKMALDLLRAMIGAGYIELTDDDVWRTNPALGRGPVTGIGGPTHQLLDRLKEQGPPWTKEHP